MSFLLHKYFLRFFIERKNCLVLCMVASMFCHVHAYAQNSARSAWVYSTGPGKLGYKTLPGGDKIIDFSYAGYMGGGVSIPTVPVVITVSPVPGDNSAVIQQAIDKVAALPLKRGIRGAVLLKPGIYDCSQTINLHSSGIVLRGSGSGKDGSVLNMTGKPHACITVKGAVVTKTIGLTTKLSDNYVPCGSFSFRVKDASIFKVGDTIRLTRQVTDEWVAFMGMDKLVRSGKKQTWMTGDIQTDRVISKIKGNLLSVDVPLTDSYDADYTGAAGVTVQKISSTGQLSQIGIEHLRIGSPAASVTINDAHHRAFTMSGLTDGWARNLEIFNTVNSVSITGKRITIKNIGIYHDLPTVGAAKPADLNGSGQQILFDRCTIKGDNLFFFATGAKVTGPVVLLNCLFSGNGWIQPHQRWATAVLVDRCEVPEGGIDFMNRGVMGSGHGWSIGWAVAWNCKAKSYLNQMPPGSSNWVIGSKGEQQRRAIPFDTLPLLPEGRYDSHGIPVSPASLYLAQLEQRLGKRALQNIGYAK